MHSGKIRIEQALTPIPLFTIMENTIYVIQGLTLLTESLDPPKIISRYLPVNFDTNSRATLLFENLRFLVSAWDTIVHCGVVYEIILSAPGCYCYFYFLPPGSRNC